MPTKEELKEKYGISNDDFEILTEMPAEEVIREKGFIMKMAEAVGVQEWMLKSWKGIVLAIIIILPNAHGILDYWKPKAIYAEHQFYGYYRHLQFPLPADNHDWIAFAPDAALPPSGANVPLSGLQVGTGVFPVSGQAPYA